MVEQTQADWFRSPGSRPSAVAAMVAGVAVAVLAALNGSVPVTLGAVLFALLAYASMWRPAVGVDDESLLLRGMYSTIVLPLAGVESVGGRGMFAATVAGRQYTSSALGGHRRPRRAGRREEVPYQDRVEAAIRALLERTAPAGPAASAAEVRRRWAWPDLALSAAVAVALVVSLL